MKNSFKTQHGRIPVDPAIFWMQLDIVSFQKEIKKCQRAGLRRASGLRNPVGDSERKQLKFKILKENPHWLRVRSSIGNVGKAASKITLTFFESRYIKQLIKNIHNYNQ